MKFSFNIGRSIKALYHEANLAPETQKSLNWIFASNNISILFGIVCTGSSAAMVGLATMLGMNDIQLGLLAAVSQLGNLTQIPYSILVNRTQKRRHYILTQGIFARFIWMPIGFLCLLKGQSQQTAQILLLAVMLIEQLLAGIIGVTWYPLFSDLAPLEIRGRWLAIRTATQSIISLVFSLVFAYLLDHLPMNSKYIIVFLISGAFGVLDLLCYLFVKEPKIENKPIEQHEKITKSIGDVFRNKPFMRFVMMWTVWCFTSSLCGSYLTPYCMNVMGLNFTQMTVFGTITSAIITAVMVKQWGNVIDRFGSKNVMAISCSVTALTPLFFLFSTPGNIWPILLHNLIGATFWSGCNLACGSMQLSMSPQKNRSVYLALYACIAGFFGSTLGTMSGGWFLDTCQRNQWFTGGFDRYKALILLAVVLRFVFSMIQIPKMDNEKSYTVAETISELTKRFKKK